MSNDMIPLDVVAPQEGQIRQLADDLFWFRFTLPFRLDHINLFALETAEGWLLLDCGINAESNAKQWPAILAQLEAKKPIIGIIISHHHADHVGYAGALACITGAPIFMGAREYEETSLLLNYSDKEAAEIGGGAYANFGLGDIGVGRRSDRGNHFRTLVGDLPEVQIVQPGHSFQTTAGVWEVRFDSGHSPGHMSLMDHARHLYIGVDFLLPRISPNISVALRDPDRDVLADYFAYLEEMCTLEYDWLIIPGHDWPFFGGAPRARQLITHHEFRLRQLLDAGVTLTTNDAMALLFPFELNEHELYFASCEARAHLNHLVTRAKMARTTNDGIALFSST